MATLKRQLSALGACKEAVGWVADRDLPTAWAECERGDWMLWLVGRMQGKKGWPNRQTIVLVACDCAELVLPIYEKRHPNDDRVRKCIAVTRQWASGEASIDDVRAARNAAADAADAAAYAAAYAAADAAADAAAYAAAYAAADAADAAARLRTWKECADICRKRLTIPVEVAA